MSCSCCRRWNTRSKTPPAQRLIRLVPEREAPATCSRAVRMPLRAWRLDTLTVPRGFGNTL